MGLVDRVAKLADAPLDQVASVCHFQVISPLGPLGELQELQIGHDGMCSRDAWFCQDVLVARTDTPGNTVKHRPIPARAPPPPTLSSSLLPPSLPPSRHPSLPPSLPPFLPPSLLLFLPPS